MKISFLFFKESSFGFNFEHDDEAAKFYGIVNNKIENNDYFSMQQESNYFDMKDVDTDYTTFESQYDEHILEENEHVLNKVEMSHKNQSYLRCKIEFYDMFENGVCLLKAGNKMARLYTSINLKNLKQILCKDIQFIHFQF